MDNQELAQVKQELAQALEKLWRWATAQDPEPPETPGDAT